MNHAVFVHPDGTVFDPVQDSPVPKEVWRCGWCKGFIVMRRVSDMQRWIHEETPVTDHEVLPYRVG